jgi:hypothetical protein
VRRDFHLRFSEWVDAQRAAKRLRARGYDAIVSSSADEDWLVVASKVIRPWQLALVERRMERLAKRLNGEYEGT